MWTEFKKLQSAKLLLASLRSGVTYRIVYLRFNHLQLKQLYFYYYIIIYTQRHMDGHIVLLTLHLLDGVRYFDPTAHLSLLSNMIHS